MSETIEERAETIRKCIDGLGDPETQMVALDMENSKRFPYSNLYPNYGQT